MNKINWDGAPRANDGLLSEAYLDEPHLTCKHCIHYDRCDEHQSDVDDACEYYEGGNGDE